jgi:cysteine desulfurase
MCLRFCKLKMYLAGEGEWRVDIYMDGAATTPLLPEVQQAMVDVFEVYGNPSSLHRKGITSEEAITRARKQVLRCLGVNAGRIVFTGCGTEANNLAIFGAAKQFVNRGRHLVTSQIEHPSILEACRALERDGWHISYVAPEADGSIRAESILSAVTDETVLVSLMHVNNETGAILPVEEIGQALREKPKTLFHVDGIQAFGKIANCVKTSNVDLYSFSGHKIGAPKGVGGLYIRDGITVTPLLFGGGQEYGLRSGTENVLGIVALGEAAQQAYAHQATRWADLEAHSSAFRTSLTNIPNCSVQRSTPSSPYIVSASFPGLRGEVLLHALEARGVFVSTGSACSSHGGQATGSHVLKAMGKSEAEITGTIRFSFGPWLSEPDFKQASEIIQEQVAWLYSLER